MKKFIIILISIISIIVIVALYMINNQKFDVIYPNDSVNYTVMDLDTLKKENIDSDINFAQVIYLKELNQLQITVYIDYDSYNIELVDKNSTRYIPSSLMNQSRLFKRYKTFVIDNIDYNALQDLYIYLYPKVLTKNKVIRKQPIKTHVSFVDR